MIKKLYHADGVNREDGNKATLYFATKAEIEEWKKDYKVLEIIEV